MAVDLRREAGVTGFQKLEERVPGEPRPNDDERLADRGHPELREDVVEKDGPGVPGREHFPMAGRANRGELVHPILTELRDEGFLVIEGEECDERLLGGGDRFVDPPQFVRPPRLDDGQDIVHRDVQRVMPSEILRSLNDDSGEAEAVGEGLELDTFHADCEGDTDFLAPLRADLVRLHLFAAVRRGAYGISGEDQVMEMP